MNKTEIMNTYAIEQGYDSWRDLYKCVNYNCNSIEVILQHIDKVTDLIQEELKKKIAENFGNEERQQVILNTEIL